MGDIEGAAVASEGARLINNSVVYDAIHKFKSYTKSYFLQ